MKPSNQNARIDLNLEVTWKKNNIRHIERYFVNGMNCWRDIAKGSLLEKLLYAQKGDRIAMRVSPGEILPRSQEEKIIKLKKPVQTRLIPAHQIMPGRFFPQGMISGVPGIFKGNRNPFRIIDNHPNHIIVDLNHPMADIPLSVRMQVVSRMPKSEERGGNCNDWMADALTGPGMQSRHHGRLTGFIFPGAFDRKDESPDERFYTIDRFVSHIDRIARQNLSGIYRRFIKPEDHILDLMAGWESHIPEDLMPVSVHGLGMNKNELEHNPQLTGYTVQDLNQDRTLYFDDHSFDVVICSLSIEYLIKPTAVFKQVARVLKPGGRFIVTFSNRWFPEKAVHLWKELHDFERMGLVLEYFIEPEKFESLSTFSIRGYPRPEDDKYAGEQNESDPLFAVTGKTYAL